MADGQLQLTGGFDAQGRDVSGGMSSMVHQYYGRWEVRVRAERGAGYSAVALLWPQTQRWPMDGEIDILEAWDGTRLQAKASVHNGPNNSMVKKDYQLDFTQWHVVAVDWLPDRIAFWVDGVNVYTVTPSTGGFGINMIPTTSPMHLALQFDKGCYNVGIPCRDASTPAEVTMYVDWVRVYDYRG